MGRKIGQKSLCVAAHLYGRRNPGAAHGGTSLVGWDATPSGYQELVAG